MVISKKMLHFGNLLGGLLGILLGGSRASFLVPGWRVVGVDLGSIFGDLFGTIFGGTQIGPQGRSKEYKQIWRWEYKKNIAQRGKIGSEGYWPWCDLYFFCGADLS